MSVVYTNPTSRNVIVTTAAAAAAVFGRQRMLSSCYARRMIHPRVYYYYNYNYNNNNGTIRHNSNSSNSSSSSTSSDNTTTTTTTTTMKKNYTNVTTNLPTLSGWRRALTPESHMMDHNNNTTTTDEDHSDDGKPRRHVMVRIWNAITQSWIDYKSTWIPSPSTEEENKEEPPNKNQHPKEEEKDHLYSFPTITQQQLKDNVKQNIQTIQKDYQNMADSEEVKVWVGEQIKFTNHCVGEFMTGYRNGRDEEVDKMLNEYFKEYFSNNNNNGDDTTINKTTTHPTTTNTTSSILEDEPTNTTIATPPKAGRKRKKYKRRISTIQNNH